MKFLFFISILILQTSISDTLAEEDKIYFDFISKHGKSILKTYRLPAVFDLSYWGTDRNSYFYKIPNRPGEVKAPYWTKGFFNEDDITDFIFILFKRGDNKAYLIGFLSEGSTYKDYLIGKSSKAHAVHTDSFNIIKNDVKLKNYPKHVIQHFHLEGHGSIIYWDTLQKKFIYY